jgi:hypothetical protein
VSAPSIKVNIVCVFLVVCRNSVTLDPLFDPSSCSTHRTDLTQWVATEADVSAMAEWPDALGDDDDCWWQVFTARGTAEVKRNRAGMGLASDWGEEDSEEGSDEDENDDEQRDGCDSDGEMAEEQRLCDDMLSQVQAMLEAAAAAVECEDGCEKLTAQDANEAEEGKASARNGKGKWLKLKKGAAAFARRVLGKRNKVNAAPVCDATVEVKGKGKTKNVTNNMKKAAGVFAKFGGCFCATASIE